MTAPKTPTDRLPKSVSPAAAEALGVRLPFTFDGVDYEIDPSSEWPYDALESFEEGRVVAFLKIILGPEQHAAFKATKPKVSDVSRFAEVIQSTVGIAGN